MTNEPKDEPKDERTPEQITEDAYWERVEKNNRDQARAERRREDA